ncbi:MAG: NAD-binding protein [bacterium]
MDKLFGRRVGGHLRACWGWYFIGVMGVGAVGLAYIGLARYYASSGKHMSGAELWLMAFGLVAGEQADSKDAGGPAVQLAKFAGGVIKALLALGLAWGLLRKYLQVLRARLSRNHVIICGLGYKGFSLARRFAASGRRVVVIEKDPANPLALACRHAGALVVFGDAGTDKMLELASVQRARELVCLVPDDGANASIAHRARRIVEASERGLAGRLRRAVRGFLGRFMPMPPPRRLSCFVHIVEPQLCGLFRPLELSSGSEGRFGLKLFNFHEGAALALLRQSPPFACGGGEAAGVSRGPRVVVVGAGRVGELLMVHCARRWMTARKDPAARMRIALVDGSATEKVELMSERHAHLSRTCRLEPFEIGPDSADFLKAAFLWDDESSPPSAIYICLPDETQSLSAALTLERAILARSPSAKSPFIAVRMTSSEGLAGMIADKGIADSGRAPLVRAFGLVETACTPELLLRGTRETMARAIHERYLRDQRAPGASPGDPRAMTPWENLPEDLKNSNREAAERVEPHVRDAGYDIVPLTDLGAPAFDFTSDEIERLAELEHIRWMEGKRRAGWKWGKTKDPAQRTHPCMVPWAALPESETKKDRANIRQIPELLADAGCTLAPME